MDPIGTRPVIPGNKLVSKEPPSGEPAPEAAGEKLDIQSPHESTFKEKLGKLKSAALSQKGRTYITSLGLGGVGLATLGAFVFGLPGAVIGAAAGLCGGIAAGALISSPLSFFKWSRTSSERVPPGSDVNLNPALKESSLLKPSVEKETDRVTDSLAVPGNRVTLEKNGVNSFPERYRMMEEAKHSINLQTLIFHSDETGWKTAELLAKKAKEGVKCRVIYDWISSADSDPKIFKMMKEAGVELQAFNTPVDYKWHEENKDEIVRHMHGAFQDFIKGVGEEGLAEPDKWIAEKGEKEFKFWIGNNEKVLERLKEYPPLLHKLNNRWHMKILTVDGKEAMLGGMNIGSEYANGGSGHRDTSLGEKAFSAGAFRDTDVKVEGPVVGKVNEAFAENWGYAGGEDTAAITAENPAVTAAGSTKTRFVSHQPREKKDRNIENWYYQMLKNAEKTAYITNAYFLPTKEFRKALIEAAKRGVDVRILTNSVDTNDLPILSQGGRKFYRELLEGGVRLYELRKDNGGKFTTLHTKASVFDGEVATIGSHNLDPRSFNLNSEDTIEIQDKDFGKGMHEMFRDDLQMSNEITLEDLNNETPADRLEQWFASEIIKDLL
ncbi:MAG: phosphatidylserine/phosphatidylglycerophosphate/cardiolipin synthase family protein [Candidatus Eremiobacteraeota bacterium]|nr:phosphatidylserine/phosphatidylglycerophosphate/cardiolipin synthase family protein [Candidatus Eremiobacteraeota bacterium]